MTNITTILTPFTALGVVEGLVEGVSEDDYHAAYQLLIDSGQAWELPGRIGRTAAALIERGICTRPTKKGIEQ